MRLSEGQVSFLGPLCTFPDLGSESDFESVQSLIPFEKIPAAKLMENGGTVGQQCLCRVTAVPPSVGFVSTKFRSILSTAPRTQQAAVTTGFSIDIPNKISPASCFESSCPAQISDTSLSTPASLLALQQPPSGQGPPTPPLSPPIISRSSITPSRSRSSTSDHNGTEEQRTGTIKTGVYTSYVKAAGLGLTVTVSVTLIMMQVGLLWCWPIPFFPIMNNNSLTSVVTPKCERLVPFLLDGGKVSYLYFSTYLAPFKVVSRMLWIASSRSFSDNCGAGVHIRPGWPASCNKFA